MKPIKLEDLMPQGAEITLKVTETEEKVFRLRPLNLADEVWLKQTFGADLEKIMAEIRFAEISRIVFHQLEPEDQKFFIKRKVEFVSEEGDVSEKMIGGYELLFHLIRGFNEKIAVFQALLQTIGVSREMQDMLTDAEKQQAEDQKKNPPAVSPQTGQSSSTDLVPTTDGPLSIYGVEP